MRLHEIRSGLLAYIKTSFPNMPDYVAIDLIYKNGFYLFQPLRINYDDIPLSMRIAQYPVKRDEFLPVKTEIKPVEVVEEVAEKRVLSSS